MRMETIAKRIGKRVKELRRPTELTQENLAQRLHMNVGSIGRIERGLASPAIETIEAIARVFEIDLAVFFTFPTEKGEQTRLDIEILSKLKELSQEDKKAIKDIIDRLIDNK